jgi:ParB-like chromosome segregation protein Spo0J
MIRIDTAADFLRLRPSLEPVPVASKRHGNIPVPCLTTLLVKRELVTANNYNPNFVPKDKMNLLKQSILDNGFCFPVVTIWDEADECFVIIDGFHRYTISGPDWLGMDYLPVVWLAHDISQRMVATVQFNKARGVHQVDLDAEVIRALIQQGKSEDEISIHLGIDLETIYRYKQLTGIAELFKNNEYSMPWTTIEVPDHG